MGLELPGARLTSGCRVQDPTGGKIQQACAVLASKFLFVNVSAQPRRRLGLPRPTARRARREICPCHVIGEPVRNTLEPRPLGLLAVSLVPACAALSAPRFGRLTCQCSFLSAIGWRFSSQWPEEFPLETPHAHAVHPWLSYSYGVALSWLLACQPVASQRLYSGRQC